MTSPFVGNDASIERELSDALNTIAPTAHTPSLTTDLLEFDRSPTYRLIGVDFSGSHAIGYHMTTNTAVAIGMGTRGLVDDRSTIASFTDRQHLRRWIASMRFYWGWLHPRYR